MAAETVPALARLLQRGSLTKLEIRFAGFPPAQETSMPVLCAGLRSCRTLTELTLRLDPVEGATGRTVTELLDAVATLPALTVLDLSGSEVLDTAAFGHALGALLRADLPNLRTLVVDDCQLGDGGMALLLDGLAANTHLCELYCCDNDVSVELTDQMMPALAALRARAELDA